MGLKIWRLFLLNEVNMILIARNRLDEFIYRLLKASAVLAIILAFEYYLDIFTSGYTMAVATLTAVIIQLIILIHLPSNDIIPKKIIRDKVADFVREEAKFILIVTFMAFFTRWQISELDYTFLLAANFSAQVALFLVWRVYNRYLLSPLDANEPGPGKKNILIVGSGRRGQKVADIFLDHPELKAHIMGFVDYNRDGLWRYRDVPLAGHPDNIRSVIASHQVDLVVMALENDPPQGGRLFDVVEQMGVKMCFLPEIMDTRIAKCRPYSLNGQPVFLYHSVPENRPALFIKELMDRTGALAGMILSAPILILAVIAIRIDSRGPILYRQKRTGKNGRVFDMYKLRTMVDEADTIKKNLEHLNEMSGPVFKIKEDPRVTAVGRFLRKYSIDEIPQFWNVLKGDMSLVGPRPPLPEEVTNFEPWQHRKLSVKPGLSCLWQINGRNEVDFEHWMKMDLQYIDRWSLKEDARILIKTIPAVFKGKGAC